MREEGADCVVQAGAGRASTGDVAERATARFESYEVHVCVGLSKKHVRNFPVCSDVFLCVGCNLSRDFAQTDRRTRVSRDWTDESCCQRCCASILQAAAPAPIRRQDSVRYREKKQWRIDYSIEG
jgi:hypothetical protein